MKSLNEADDIKEICNGVTALVSAVMEREFQWQYDNDRELIIFTSGDDEKYEVNVFMSSVKACLKDIARQFISEVRI